MLKRAYSGQLPEPEFHASDGAAADRQNRLSNLRQILNFSIMMILVQAVNVSIFCMIHARTRQFGLYMAVIALFVFVMAGNIFLTEYMFAHWQRAPVPPG